MRLLTRVRKWIDCHDSVLAVKMLTARLYLGGVELLRFRRSGLRFAGCLDCLHTGNTHLWAQGYTSTLEM